MTDEPEIEVICVTRDLYDDIPTISPGEVQAGDALLPYKWLESSEGVVNTFVRGYKGMAEVKQFILVADTPEERIVQMVAMGRKCDGCKLVDPVSELRVVMQGGEEQPRIVCMYLCDDCALKAKRAQRKKEKTAKGRWPSGRPQRTVSPGARKAKKASRKAQRQSRKRGR